MITSEFDVLFGTAVASARISLPQSAIDIISLLHLSESIATTPTGPPGVHVTSYV
jgi:hypothetical protein